MDSNLNERKNIVGLSSLLKDDDIESTMDLAELEREIANGAAINDIEEVNVADEYKKEMDRLSRNFDIGTHDTGNHSNIPDNISVSSSPIQSIKVHSPPSSPKANPILSRNAYNSPKAGGSHMAYEVPEPVNSWNSYEPRDSQLRSMTQEETKQNRINQVLRDIDDRELEFNIEKEKEDDDKASLLEQIDMLRITLDDDGIDIKGVPEINKKSTMKDVQNVYKILRLKNDRNRYCSFAEELILAGAYGLEYAFDGKKDWMGRKPDLTGWSDSVRCKLRRMRFETSTFVQEVMQEYNLSAGMRLALELLPSMFLYSRNRRLTQNDNLVSDNDYKEAISKLNELG
jgi:hypothetical protein